MSYLTVPNQHLVFGDIHSIDANSREDAIQKAKNLINGDTNKAATIERSGNGNDHKVWLKQLSSVQEVKNNPNAFTLYFGHPAWSMSIHHYHQYSYQHYEAMERCKTSKVLILSNLREKHFSDLIWFVNNFYVIKLRIIIEKSLVICYKYFHIFYKKEGMFVSVEFYCHLMGLNWFILGKRCIWGNKWYLIKNYTMKESIFDVFP